MDGMLMEWEKMLPDPDELNDLEHPDIMDTDLQIFGEKTESMSIPDTINSDGVDSGKITPTAAEADDSEKTVKLIDELNDFNDNAEKSNQSQLSSSNGIHDNISSPRFENCLDSPLQISDVRTGDIPSEKETEAECKVTNQNTESTLVIGDCRTLNQDSDHLTDFGENEQKPNCTEENSNTVTMVTEKKMEDDTEPGSSLERNVKLGYIQLDERKNFMDKSKDLNSSVNSDAVDTSSKSQQGNSSNEKTVTTLNKNETGETQISQTIQASKITGEITSPDNSTLTGIKVSNTSICTSNTEQAGFLQTESSAENNFVMLAIKQEPVDTEDYGKPQEFGNVQEYYSRPQEFFTNFYDDMDGRNGQEIDYSGPTDYTLTENGLYQCTYCSARMTDYNIFRYHVQERHKTMYQCKSCDQNFYRSQQLAIHCRLHHSGDKEKTTNKKPRTSIIIGKKKKAKVSYDANGIQFYKCAYCSRKFYVQQALASHVRNVHHYNFNTKDRQPKSVVIKKDGLVITLDGDGTQVYKCLYCDEEFNDLQDLTSHNDNIHPNGVKREKAKVSFDGEGNPTYKCAYCDEKFIIQQALACHVKNVHMYPKDKVAKKKKGMKDQREKETDGEESSNPADQNTNEKFDVSFPEESELKEKKPESISKRVLLYKNMSFESDSNQIEESLANSDCSLKRELKSSKIYHCSKCSKWFYREKQLLDHEKSCTFVKEEPDDDDMEIKQEVEMNDGSEDKRSRRQKYLKKQREIKEKMDVEMKIQAEMKKKIKQNSCPVKKTAILCGSPGYHDGYMEKSSQLISLPKFFCKYCPSGFNVGKEMNLHLIKHLGEVVRMANGIFKCRVCEIHVTTKKNMLAHLQHHTILNIDNLFGLSSIPECIVCGQPFVNDTLLKKHQNKHLANMGKNKSFSSKEEPKKHEEKNKPQSSVEMPPNLKEIIKAGILSRNIVGISQGNHSSVQSGDQSYDKDGVHIDLKGNNSENTVENKTTVGTAGSMLLSVQGTPTVTQGEKTVNLNDIPFECGMCHSRFPNSQYLLHHITLHMQGPYVFKIEVDKKGQDTAENNVKMDTQAQESSLEEQQLNSQILGMSEQLNMQTIGMSEQLNNRPNAMSGQLNSQALGMSEKLSNQPIGMSEQLNNVQIVKSSNPGSYPLILNMPDLKKMSMHNSSAAKSTTVTQPVVTSSANIHAIAQDHMYTNSLLKPKVKGHRSETVKNLNMDDNNSETDSAATEEESLASYDTDECEKLENEVSEKNTKFAVIDKHIHEKNKDIHEKKSFVKKRKLSQDNQLDGGLAKMPNFKKCYDIASGQWFECPYCLNLSETTQQLKQHMQSHEKNNMFEKMVACVICDQKMVSRWHLSRHMEQNHKKDSYKCHFCEQRFLTSSQVIEHVQETHIPAY